MAITTITLTDLDAAISAIKNTASTKVEWNDASASLKLIVSDIRTMLFERGIFYASDINEMKSLRGTDTTFVHVNGVGASNGIYSFRNAVGTANNITSFDATGGGLWVLVTTDTPT